MVGACNRLYLRMLMLHLAITSKSPTQRHPSKIPLRLKYIYNSGMVHLDIKPSNIFICHKMQSDAPGNPEEVKNEAS